MDELHPFPLLALVEQAELKTALLIALINPQVGGVLLSGPYGVGKTTAVRGLVDIMPPVSYHNPDDDTPHTRPMRLVELPLHAQMEDVVGGANARVALEQQRVLLEEGVLARAHQNVLYVDEINLLPPPIIDAILDATAQGRTMVRRGMMVRLFASQFVLIGSMNPEEGTLRPQIMDRFGLRVWVSPLVAQHNRLEVYRRTRLFRSDPAAFRRAYAAQTEALAEEVAVAREILPHVVVPPDIELFALALIHELQIPSHRAEIALLEAARARAAADFRSHVVLDDVRQVAVLALRQRRSAALEAYAQQMQAESTALDEVMNNLLASATPPPTPPPTSPTPPTPPIDSGVAAQTTSSVQDEANTKKGVSHGAETQQTPPEAG